MINYVTGDLFDLIEPNTIITHVVNSKGCWGSGFVIPLGQHYPKAKEGYKKWYDAKFDYHSGTFSLGNTQIISVTEDNSIYVANMIAQTLYVRKRPLYYNKLVTCMERVKIWASHHNFDILAPKFGSDRAGGNWDFIECLIEDIWDDLNVTIVKFSH